MLRFTIHRRTSVSGAVAVADLLNCREAYAVSAAGGLDHDLIPDAVADQGLAQRRLVANAPGFRIGLGGTHDAVSLFVGAVLGETNGVAHPDNAPLRLRLDQDVVLDDRLELLDPRFHHALLVLGRVVLEVLGKVAQLARGLDLGHDRGPAHRRQLPQLLADCFQTLWGDVDVVHPTESSAAALGIRNSLSSRARP